LDCRFGSGVFDDAHRAGLFGRVFLHGFLHLLEGADFDLADALAADVELGGKLFQRHRVFGKAASLEDAAFAVVQHGHGTRQHGAAGVEFVLLDQRLFLAVMVVDQPILPFAGFAFAGA
jgi:hypothetical protein